MSGNGFSAGTAWSIQTWQLDDGLPNNSVTSLAQTSDGYLWVATPSRLSRFDGAQFEEFLGRSVVPDHDERISTLLTGHDGSLWLAMDHGPLARLRDGKASVFTNAFPNSNVQSLTEDNEGAIWISYRSGNGTVCRLKDGQVTEFTADNGFPGRLPCSLAKDNQGCIWFAKGNNIGRYRNGRLETLTRLRSPNNFLCGAAAGGVWICSDFQLFSYTADGELKRVGTFTPDHATTVPTVMWEDRSGTVWIGTSDSGLFYYRGSTLDRVPELKGNVLCLGEDREGDLWVGTDGGGLSRIRPRVIELKGTDAGLPFAAVQSLCEETNGMIWAVTQNGFLVKGNDDEWDNFSTHADWPGGVATCVTRDDRGAVWVGTQDQSLHRRYEEKWQTWGAAEGLASRNLHALLATAAGDLWIGGNAPESLQCLRDGKILDVELPAGAGVIRAMVEDPSGDLWVGTTKHVFLRVHDGKVIDEALQVPGYFVRSIRALRFTPDGSLWIGYAGWGLGRLKDGHYARITVQDGLDDDFISQIVDDGRGWLWFGADHGIFKVRQEELDAVAEGRSRHVESIHYGKGQGLPNLQANFDDWPGALRDREGRLWMPMRSGLAVVRPEKASEDRQPVPLLIKRVMVDERTAGSYGGVVPAQEGMDLRPMPSELRLPAGYHRLKFEFTALNLSAPENVHFRYRLDGFDDDWIDAGTQRHVDYSRLAAGRYRFRVKACNGSGIWNREEATFAFAVAPFLWQTWWFRLSVVPLFTAAVFVIARYISFRRLRRRLRLLERQAALDKERARIAQDLHDDLGGRLTEVELMLELAHRAPAAEGNGKMDQIAATVRRAGESLDEIVWAVNPRHDTLPRLLDYLGEYAIGFLQRAAIRCRVDFPDDPPPDAVPPEVRHNVFLAVKEALNNVARHSQATEIWLRVAIDGTAMTIAIEDNGKGFSGAADHIGADGLRNMHQRMQDIGGKFHVESQPGRGTCIRMTLPWPPEPKTAAGD